MTEYGYLELLEDIIDNGQERKGRNGNTLSIFGSRIEFLINKSFPILTTKRVFFRGVVEELLWFLKGSTNAKELQDKDIHIWDGNTSREYLDSVGLTDMQEGYLGPGYGYQWRSFGGNYPNKDGVDQLEYILKELITNPHGRRCILSAWNPNQMPNMALPPCHMTYQFYIDKHGLSCQMYMRSCDVAAGLPFNICSTALFTLIIAKILNISTHKIIIITGDTHLYEEHLENVKIQLKREPLLPPTINIKKKLPESFLINKDSNDSDSDIDYKPTVNDIPEIIKWIEELQYQDFELLNYKNHGPIQFKMVV